MRILITNLKIYYSMTFRNVFLCISAYLMPLLFYFMFSSVLITISPSNSTTIIMSMSVFAVLMNSYIGLPGNAVKYAAGNIKRAYIAGGVKLWHVFVCIAVNNFIHSAIVCLIIFTTAPIIFKAQVPDNIPVYILTLSVGILMSTTIGMLIGMFSKTESIAVVVSQVFFLPSIFFSGIMMPVSVLPVMLRNFSVVLPARQMYMLLLNSDKVMPLIYAAVFVCATTVLLLFRYRYICSKE